MKDNPFYRYNILNCRNADCNAVLTEYELERGKQFCISCRTHPDSIQRVECLRCGLTQPRPRNIMRTRKMCVKCEQKCRNEYRILKDMDSKIQPGRPCDMPGCYNTARRFLNGVNMKYCSHRHKKKARYRRERDRKRTVTMVANTASGDKSKAVLVAPIVQYTRKWTKAKK